MKLKLKLSNGTIKEVEGTPEEIRLYESQLAESGEKYEVVKESGGNKKKLLLDSKRFDT
jgi:hypothetical protein